MDTICRYGVPLKAAPRPPKPATDWRQLAKNAVLAAERAESPHDVFESLDAVRDALKAEGDLDIVLLEVDGRL